jgi:hypothetical protein
MLSAFFADCCPCRYPVWTRLVYFVIYVHLLITYLYIIFVVYCSIYLRTWESGVRSGFCVLLEIFLGCSY